LCKKKEKSEKLRNEIQSLVKENNDTSKYIGQITLLIESNTSKCEEVKTEKEQLQLKLITATGNQGSGAPGSPSIFKQKKEMLEKNLLELENEVKKEVEEKTAVWMEKTKENMMNVYMVEKKNSISEEAVVKELAAKEAEQKKQIADYNTKLNMMKILLKDLKKVCPDAAGLIDEEISKT